MSIKLEPGQIVDIFEDPLTCKNLEGTAKLICRTDGSSRHGLHNGRRVEGWEVRFTADIDAGEEETYHRTILGATEA